MTAPLLLGLCQVVCGTNSTQAASASPPVSIAPPTTPAPTSPAPSPSPVPVTPAPSPTPSPAAAAAASTTVHEAPGVVSKVQASNCEALPPVTSSGMMISSTMEVTEGPNPIGDLSKSTISFAVEYSLFSKKGKMLGKRVNSLPWGHSAIIYDCEDTKLAELSWRWSLSGASGSPAELDITDNGGAQLGSLRMLNDNEYGVFDSQDHQVAVLHVFKKHLLGVIARPASVTMSVVDTSSSAGSTLLDVRLSTFMAAGLVAPAPCGTLWIGLFCLLICLGCLDLVWICSRSRNSGDLTYRDLEAAQKGVAMPLNDAQSQFGTNIPSGSPREFRREGLEEHLKPAPTGIECLWCCARNGTATQQTVEALPS